MNDDDGIGAFFYHDDTGEPIGTVKGIDFAKDGGITIVWNAAGILTLGRGKASDIKAPMPPYGTLLRATKGVFQGEVAMALGDNKVILDNGMVMDIQRDNWEVIDE